MEIFCFPAGPGWMAAAWGENGLWALVLPLESPAAAGERLASLVGGEVCPLPPPPLSAHAPWEVQFLAGQVQRYFRGERVLFSVPVDWSGYTPFQQRVLEKVGAIPYGETRTYSQLAREAGSPRAARAVGAAVAKNRTPLVIP